MNVPHLRFIKWALIITILCLGMLLPVQARELSWEEMHQQAVSLYQRGKYPQAHIMAQQAWKVAQNTFTPEDTRNADSLVILGSIERVLGLYDRADDDFQSALIIREKGLGTVNFGCVECLTNLAEMEIDQEDYEKAAYYGEQALAIAQKTLTADTPAMAEISVLMAEIEAGQGKFTEASQTCEPALAILKNSYGKNRPAMARALIITAQINYGLGQETKSDLADAREILDDFNKGKSEWMGAALFLEGKINLDKGDYRKAESSYKKAQTIWEDALSPNHPLVGKALCGLAYSDQAQKEYSKALPLYEKAHKIWGNAFGLEHPLLAKVSYYEAEMRYFCAMEFQAGLLYHQSMLLQEKLFGPDNLGMVARLNQIAEIYQIHGQYQESETLCNQAFDILISISQTTDPELGLNRSLRGRVYLEQGKLGDADTEIQAALKILQSSFPNGDLEITKCMLNQARLLTLVGKYEEASALYKEHFASLEKAFGPKHLYLAMILEERAVLALKLGRAEEAKKLQQRARTIRANKQAKSLNFSQKVNLDSGNV